MTYGQQILDYLRNSLHLQPLAIYGDCKELMVATLEEKEESYNCH